MHFPALEVKLMVCRFVRYVAYFPLFIYLRSMKLRLGESGVTMYVNSQDYTGEVWFNYNVEVENVTVSPDTYILEI